LWFIKTVKKVAPAFTDGELKQLLRAGNKAEGVLKRSGHRTKPARSGFEIKGRGKHSADNQGTEAPPNLEVI